MKYIILVQVKVSKNVLKAIDLLKKGSIFAAC